jgi:hypothetical protein
MGLHGFGPDQQAGHQFVLQYRGALGSGPCKLFHRPGPDQGSFLPAAPSSTVTASALVHPQVVPAFVPSSALRAYVPTLSVTVSVSTSSVIASIPSSAVIASVPSSAVTASVPPSAVTASVPTSALPSFVPNSTPTSDFYILSNVNYSAEFVLLDYEGPRLEGSTARYIYRDNKI